MLTIGTAGFDAIKNAKDLFWKDGEYNSQLAKTLALPDVATASGVLGAEASQAYNSLYGAVQDKLRLESGAAIPPAEIKQAMRRYAPAPFDTEATAKQKVDSLYDTLETYTILSSRGIDVTELVKKGVTLDEMKNMGGEQQSKTTKADPLGLR